MSSFCSLMSARSPFMEPATSTVVYLSTFLPAPACLEVLLVLKLIWCEKDFSRRYFWCIDDWSFMAYVDMRTCLVLYSQPTAAFSAMRLASDWRIEMD